MEKKQDYKGNLGKKNWIWLSGTKFADQHSMVA